MHAANEGEPIPAGQSFYDNYFLLLLIGIVVPTIIYTVWGLYDIYTIPTLPVVP